MNKASAYGEGHPKTGNINGAAGVLRPLARLALAGCLLTTLNAADLVPRIPLRVGLTIVTAVSDRQGDYESIKRIESADADSWRLKYSTERPKPLDILGDVVLPGDPIPFRPLVSSTVYRNILRKDLVDSHLYLQQFSPPPLIPETFPGATAVGVSTAVLEELKTKGQCQITVYQTPFPGFPLKVDRQPGEIDFRLSGTITRVEPNSVPVPVIVNNKLTNLPAIHAQGPLSGDPSEFYILDDPRNPLMLRFKIGKDSLTVVKINYPGDVEFVSPAAGQPSDDAVAQSGDTVERSLADTGRADVYGIYFSFGSDKIRDESEPVLKDIADMLGRHPAWKLNVDGHTDNIGGNPDNQDLSNRRAAAVVKALVGRYHIAPDRLTPAGFGASRPKATNDTLEGRALNRRVELVKQ
jgi:outer membrane protein OmpA-like peptidoglycan-associated protein